MVRLGDSMIAGLQLHFSDCEVNYFGQKQYCDDGSGRYDIL